MKLTQMELHIEIWEHELYLNDYTIIPPVMLNALTDYFNLLGGTDREFNETYVFGTNSIEEDVVIELIEKEFKDFKG